MFGEPPNHQTSEPPNLRGKVRRTCDPPTLRISKPPNHRTSESRGEVGQTSEFPILRTPEPSTLRSSEPLDLVGRFGKSPNLRTSELPNLRPSFACETLTQLAPYVVIRNPCGALLAQANWHISNTKLQSSDLTIIITRST